MSNGYKKHHHHHHHHNQNNHHTTTTYLPLLCRASTQDIKVVLPTFSGDPTSPRVSCTGHVKRSIKVTGFPTPPAKFTTSTTAAAATPSGRRPTHNSTHSTYRAGPIHQPRINKSKSAPRTPLTTITASPRVCGLSRGQILNSNNYSTLRAGITHKRTTAAATTAAAATPVVPRPARGLILNSNYSTLKALNTTTTTTTSVSGKSNFDYTKLKRVLFSGNNLAGPTTGNSCRSKEMKMVNCRRTPEFSDECRRSYDVELDPPLPVVKKAKEPGFDREEVNLWKRRSSTSGIELKSLKIQQIHNPFFSLSLHFLTCQTIHISTISMEAMKMKLLITVVMMLMVVFTVSATDAPAPSPTFDVTMFVLAPALTSVAATTSGFLLILDFIYFVMIEIYNFYFVGIY